jgi:hypothetical protein
MDRRLLRLMRGRFRQDSFLRQRDPEGIPPLVSAFPAANMNGRRIMVTVKELLDAQERLG